MYGDVAVLSAGLGVGLGGSLLAVTGGVPVMQVVVAAASLAAGLALVVVGRERRRRAVLAGMQDARAPRRRRP